MSNIELLTVNSAGKTSSRRYKSMKNAEAAQKRYGGIIYDEAGQVSPTLEWFYDAEFSGCVRTTDTESGTYLPMETHEEGVYESFDDCMDAQVYRVVPMVDAKAKSINATKKGGGRKINRACKITVHEHVNPYKVDSTREGNYKAIISSNTVGEAFSKRKELVADDFRLAINKGIITLEGEYSL